MPNDPMLKVLSVRATATKANYWKSQAFARGLTLQSLVADAVEEFISNHPLTNEQHTAYQARFEQLKKEMEK